MPKIYSRLFKLQLFVCLALVFSINIFAQNDALKSDLTKSFKKFDIVRMDGRNALRRQEAGRQILNVPTAAKNFELNLTLNDLRSSRYRAEAATADGVRKLEKGKVNTYKGTITGENNSQVRLTIDDEKVEGFFAANGAKYFIEPAKRHSAFAAANDLVVYREGDFLNKEGFACFSETEEKIAKGIDYVLPEGNLSNLTSYKIIEIATDADSQYVSATGGSAATNAEILSILNMVEGLYQNEIGLTISVVYQHTWETQDSYDASTLVNLLASFKNYWNVNYPASQYPRDTAHLWTGKFLNQGRANIGVVCNPASAYGISGRSEWQEAKFLISGHEIGHNLGANHAEIAQSCDSTIMNAGLVLGVTQFSFCAYSRTEISNYVAPNGGCLSPQTSATRFDFDGDNKSDVAVFRPSNGVWYINKSTGSFSAFQFGQNGDKTAAADYDGDGKTDAGIYRNGAWYVLRSSDGAFQGTNFGIAGDIPTVADFDGDGKADYAVFRPSNGVWYRLNSSNGAFAAAQFGTDGDVPVAGDYDGDGKADINLFRPSNGVWYRLNSSNGAFFAAQFGLSEDKAVAGDFDGDGKDDIAVWRPSSGNWYVLRSSNGGFQAVQFGLSGDIPTAADFDGDGKADYAVFRPSNGVWYRLNSSNGAFAGLQFGLSSDIPAQSYYIR